MDSIDQASPQSIEAKAKPIEHIKKNLLVDIALVNQPDRGSIMTSAIKKEVTTQLTWSGAAPRPPCICL